MNWRTSLFTAALLCALSLARSAEAQTCPSATGPDVIVGDVWDVGNHPAVGAIDAISLGTYSCNIGTIGLQWQSSNNHHPVIGGTLYRHRVENGAGRFEQIGMSWLKHGFLATTDSLCCTCNPPGTGSILGIGCADLYSSGLNGSQSGLGPRWQVNAHTGVFTYPPANPTFPANIGRRLQFALADIDTSASVRYYGETCYVSPDDAAAGNQNNNASYRQMTVSGGPANFNFAMSGATKRMLPAIREWPLIEPGVTLTDVQVPNDGLFIVGSNATDLGTGFWHYEFAVYNQNSDRNGGAFTVFVPAGVTLQNVGFHDVAYHDGDGPGNVNMTGTDWPAAIGATSISWACDTEATSASANALRWSSTYNFRFDANVGPINSTVRLGLWKAGAPAEIDVAAQVPNVLGASGQAFCFGDGSGSACPCGNASAVGSDSGCLNTSAQGAKLVASGIASIANDTFVLEGSGMPATSPVLYFQGTSRQNGGAGDPFGDGLRCAGGTLVRLQIEINVAGASQHPAPGDPPIHVSGLTNAGDVRTYQGWHRDVLSFCTTAPFNLTNGWETTWAP